MTRPTTEDFATEPTTTPEQIELESNFSQYILKSIFDGGNFFNRFCETTQRPEDPDGQDYSEFVRESQ